MDRAAKCPICGKETAEKTKPFCSSRCSMIDLGRWLGEGYCVPAADPEAEDELPPDPHSGENSR